MKIQNILDRFKEFEYVVQEWEKNLAQRQRVEKRFNTYTGWVYVLGDVHVPFTDWELVYQHVLPDIAANKEKALVVLPGDSLSFDLFSRYRKASSTPLPEGEIRVLRKFLSTLTKDLKREVIMIFSNHEARIYKFIRDNIKGFLEQQEILNFLKTWDDLLGMSNLYMVMDWMVQIADIVVSHGEPGSRIKGKVNEWAINYFLHGPGKHYITNYFQVVAQAHTHQQSLGFYCERVGIEVGVLSKPLDYQFCNQPYSYGKYGDWSRGYAKLKVVKGITDRKEIRLINLDPILWNRQYRKTMTLEEKFCCDSNE